MSQWLDRLCREARRCRWGNRRYRTQQNRWGKHVSMCDQSFV